MRILIATGIYPPQIGGPATYSKLLYDELPKRGISVEIANFGDYLDKPKFIRHFLYFRELLHRASNVDLIYAQDPVSVGLPALLVSQIYKKRFFIRVAGDYAWEQAVQRFGVKDGIDEFQYKKYDVRTEILRKIQRFVVDGAEKIVTPSNYFRNLVSAWCEKPEKVKTIYNGIEDVGIRLTKVNARGLLNLPVKGKVVLSSGRLVPWKGFDVLIRIAQSWKNEGRTAFLVILGDGPDKSRLQSLVASSNITDFVIFAGSTSREKTLHYLAAADTYALNTGFESFSFAVVEAMRAGVPVVATASGSIPELIESGKEGVLVPYGDEKEFKFWIENVLSDSTLRRKFVKNAKKKSEKFSIENTINNLMKII